MPIFEYRCAACSAVFEHLHGRAGEAAPQCPRCGAASVDRVLSVFAVTRPSTTTPPGPCGSADCACRRS